MSDTHFAYLLLYDPAIGTKKEVSEFLNENGGTFLDWYTVLPNSFFVISSATAAEVAETFKEFTLDEGRFLVADLETDRAGWLPKGAWRFMST